MVLFEIFRRQLGMFLKKATKISGVVKIVKVKT